MVIFAKIHDFEAFLLEKRGANKTIGFVPTMGALHFGHISLIEQSKKTCDITVCSVFVNPTQFNDKKDLENYPRMPEKDAKLLQDAGCDVLFMPTKEEVYPQTDTRVFTFGYLDTVLEGAYRPGHFNGVAQVVSRLFDIVKPTFAFFGSKDYQQVMIVKALVAQLKLDVKIIACPILRQADGLAMSSRNMLLSAEERKAALLIPTLLQKSKNLKHEGKTIAEIKNFVEDVLLKNTIYKLNYFAICNAQTLKPLSAFEKNTAPIALIACFVGKIRLIDNMEL